MRVLFYVKTRHGANMDGMPDTYREKVCSNLGVTLEEVTKFTNEFIINSAKAVKEDFGDIFGGIFLDETSPWLDETLQNKVIENYTNLYKQLKQELGHDTLIVINPGSNTPKSMMDACDIALTYESDAAKYIDPATKYIHPDHYKGIPSWRFWHVIHGATQQNIDAVFAKADSLGIGNLYVTDRTFKVGDGSEDHPQENPYDIPPSPWVEDRVRAWIKGVLPFEKRLAALELKMKRVSHRRGKPPALRRKIVATFTMPSFKNSDYTGKPDAAIRKRVTAPTVTDEQIQNMVKKYLTEHPPEAPQASSSLVKNSSYAVTVTHAPL